MRPHFRLLAAHTAMHMVLLGVGYKHLCYPTPAGVKSRRTSSSRRTRRLSDVSLLRQQVVREEMEQQRAESSAR